MKNVRKKRKKYLLVIPVILLLVVITIYGHWAMNRMQGYISRSSEANMTAVMEQMRQIYDLQIGKIYERLGMIEKNLFPYQKRLTQTKDCREFLVSMIDNSSEQILFLKDNGQAMTIQGELHNLDVESSTLLKLRQEERIAQSIAWHVDMKRENYYLIALPCETYEVDGERFSAIGMLYNRSGLDDLIKVNDYDGQAILFSVDENGIVIYTNQEDEKFERNYALLKHMQSEKKITDSQYKSLKKKLESGENGMEQIEVNGVSCYFGFCQLESTKNEIVGIVPVSVLNESLIEYQELAVQMIVFTIILFMLLSLALMLFISKAASATQKAQYEEETRRIKEEAMVALEIEKERADHANHAKSQFLSNMSHDIRTPMNAIVGFTSLAITHIDDKERLQNYLRKICTSSEHLLSLINDVLDMSRIESGKMKIIEAECSISVMTHDLRSILVSSINAKRLDFFIDTIDVEHEDVICDKSRVNQVLINITSNAIKYTQPGGTIAVKIKEKPNAPEGFADFEFSVKDNGIGMSEEFVKTIFEPFTREHSSTVSQIEGTGLGMAITKNIVDMMGGSISVQSVPGEGSEFTVKLRFRTTKNKKVITVIPKLKGFRALVADDNMDSCSSVTKMLRTIGMRPEWTTSGKEAVFRSEMAIDENDPFRVYIIDWLMPDMNGVEVVRRIREKIGEDVPIIILTAYDWSDIEKEAREAGVTAFCSKPLFLSELYDILHCAGDECDEVSGENSNEEFVGKRILVVDDVKNNREITAAILEERGIEVEMGENGKEAIEMVAGSEPGYYDLILMDVMMPVMDGYDATEIIRNLENRKLASIPIIAMTANAFEEDRRNAFNAGMDDYLSKPVQNEKLFDMLRKYL